MADAAAGLRVVLVGGTSHAGKSTLAAALAARLGGAALSTDKLARHPGRPWRHGEAIPPHVVEHYGTLGPEALIASVMAHYERMWPGVRALIEPQAGDAEAPRLVLEGSALLPARVAGLGRPDVGALWLTADEALLARRMHAESRYEAADAAGRRLIDAFLERTRRYQRLVAADVERLGLASLEVHGGEGAEALADRALRLLASR